MITDTDTYTAQLEDALEEIEFLRRQNEILLETVENLEDDIANMVVTYSRDIERYEDDLSTLQTRCELLEDEREEVKDELAVERNLRIAIETEAEDKIKELRQKIDILVNNIQTQQHEIDALKMKLSIAQEDRDYSLEREKDTLKAYNRLSTRYTYKEEEAESLSQLCSEMANKLATYDSNPCEDIPLPGTSPTGRTVKMKFRAAATPEPLPKRQLTEKEKERFPALAKLIDTWTIEAEEKERKKE